MLVTKEQQEALVEIYIKEKHTTDECVGFIDGINKTMELVKNISANTPVMRCFDRMQKATIFFRIENDEEGYYISIIDRQIYPRVWADNFANGDSKIIIETGEHILNRTVAISEKDWSERFFGETIHMAAIKVNDWMDAKNIA